MKIFLFTSSIKSKCLLETVLFTEKIQEANETPARRGRPFDFFTIHFDVCGVVVKASDWGSKVFQFVTQPTMAQSVSR